MGLTWRREWGNVAGRRTLRQYVAHSLNHTITIEGQGGFITCRTFILTVLSFGHPYLTARFFSLAEAQGWAEGFAVNHKAEVTSLMLSPAYI